MNSDRLRTLLSSRAFWTIAGSTVLLTSAFVGVAVLWEGRIVAGATSRLPFYVLVFAIGFILALWKLDDRERDGAQILIATTGIGLGTGLLAGFATEGAYYAAHEPTTVIQRGLLVLFMAAAIICTGLGIWGVRHWREFVGPSSSSTSADVEMEPME
ncbi:hypothetical protein [Halovivax sp.]|uniref:hypothetical protein n=1 Tax=Halovivax sp. TaxID=1935978 RepID=UPI0025BDC09A|nr:hypothetical protein [Halovivax sp.]